MSERIMIGLGATLEGVCRCGKKSTAMTWNYATADYDDICDRCLNKKNHRLDRASRKGGR